MTAILSSVFFCVNHATQGLEVDITFYTHNIITSYFQNLSVFSFVFLAQDVCQSHVYEVIGNMDGMGHLFFFFLFSGVNQQAAMYVRKDKCNISKRYNR